jgi:signal transduction histidine kinase
MPPPHVLQAYAERTARVQQRWLPYWGIGLLLLSAQWGVVQATHFSSESRALLFATHLITVVLAVWWSRGATRSPAHIRYAGVAMLLGMIVSGSVYGVLLGATEGSILLVVGYVLSARMMLAGSVGALLVVAAACVVNHVISLSISGVPLLTVVANASVLVVVSALLLVGMAVQRDQQLGQLYRRRLNRMVFELASHPAAVSLDVASAVGRITELSSETLAVDRAEVWLLNEDESAMRLVDGYDRAARRHRTGEDLPQSEHPAYVSGLRDKPLVQLYGPSDAGTTELCPHATSGRVARVLEAAIRIRGRTGGVLCFQHNEPSRAWTADEERFASVIAHLVALATETSERQRAEAVLRQTVTELEQRGAELSRTVAMLNEHIHERRNVERQLRETGTRLRALSTRLLQVQEEERRRMAREIHDQLGQTLTALRLDVAWLGRRLDTSAPQVLEKLDRMGALVDSTVESVQVIARNLRPPLLDDVGLAAALEWQAREFEERTGIACRLSLERDNLQLDAERAIAVFRLVQEALTNVTRHAEATRVRIDVEDAHGWLVITVRDNGRGIRRAEVADRNSLGLLGMRERVHLWGGRLRIQGRRGRGTLVRAEIPLLEPVESAEEVG